MLRTRSEGSGHVHGEVVMHKAGQHLQQHPGAHNWSQGVTVRPMAQQCRPPWLQVNIISEGDSVTEWVLSVFFMGFSTVFRVFRVSG